MVCTVSGKVVDGEGVVDRYPVQSFDRFFSRAVGLFFVGSVAMRVPWGIIKSGLYSFGISVLCSVGTVVGIRGEFS